MEIKALEYEKYICTECYKFGAHGDVTYGNWWQYWGQFAVVAPIILIPSLIYLAVLFVLFVIAKGRFIAIDNMEMFPLAQYLPEKLHTVLVCPHCKKVNTQARIKDQNGQTALHFHKKTGMHLRNEPAAKPMPKERKLDPEEF